MGSVLETLAGTETINRPIPKDDSSRIIIIVDHLVKDSVDIMSNELEINYSSIPSGVRKGIGLGKDYVTAQPMSGIQCNASVEHGLEKEQKEMLEICTEMGRLAKQLRDLNERCKNSEEFKKYLAEAKWVQM